MLPADPALHYPHGVAGKRACPPEDMGGVWGYAEFLALSVPRPPLPPLAALSQYEDVQPDFSVTNETAPAVAEICARLDGLPLAIELVAARSRLLSPEAPRLGKRLRVATVGARDLPDRQRTLRAAMDWSYDLRGTRFLMAVRKRSDGVIVSVALPRSRLCMGSHLQTCGLHGQARAPPEHSRLDIPAVFQTGAAGKRDPHVASGSECPCNGTSANTSTPAQHLQKPGGMQDRREKSGRTDSQCTRRGLWWPRSTRTPVDAPAPEFRAQIQRSGRIRR